MKSSRDHPRVALAMIVRNESHVIERCLGSVRPLIDTWTIIDTGSTDETVELAQGALAGIPGRVHSRPWVDFSTNRNELMELAQPTADYLLLLDADMVVRILEDNPMASLTEPVYDILVEPGLNYRMPYLVSTSIECAYVGRTHEYLNFGSDYTGPARLDTIAFTHLGDGGTRAEKFERDLLLLEADVAEDPENARAVFYLAQTRENLGDGPGALAAYRRRIALGGWDEEVFWSMYRSANILDTAGDWPAAAQMHVTAWEFRPHRAEPLFHLARGQRERGAHMTALMWATRGKELAYPEQDRLFVERWIYDWGIDLELSASLWWNGRRDEAHEIWRRLAARHDLTDTARATVQNNLTLPV